MPPYVTWLRSPPRERKGDPGHPLGLLPSQNPGAMPPEKHSSLDGERPGPSPVLREARFLPSSGWGRHTCQLVTVILPPAPQEPCKSLAFHPPICTPRPVSPRPCSPHSPAFPAARGERLSANARGRRAPEGGGERAPAAWEQTEPPVPGREPKGRHRLPGASREWPGLQRPTPGLREPPRGAAGSGARRAPPARGRNILFR